MSPDRDRMIAESMRSGLSKLDASLLTDISKHAFDQAFETAQRILDTCPPQLRLAAFASVLASFATVLRDQLPEHWSAFAASDAVSGSSTVITLPERKPDATQ